MLNLPNAFISYLKAEGKINWYQRIIHMGIKAQLLLAVLVLGFIAGGFLLVIPWVSEKAVRLIPLRYDISMGHSFYNQYLNNNSVDSAKSEALNLFAGQLHNGSL